MFSTLKFVVGSSEKSHWCNNSKYLLRIVQHFLTVFIRCTRSSTSSLSPRSEDSEGTLSQKLPTSVSSYEAQEEVTETASKGQAAAGVRRFLFVFPPSWLGYSDVLNHFHPMMTKVQTIVNILFMQMLHVYSPRVMSWIVFLWSSKRRRFTTTFCARSVTARVYLKKKGSVLKPQRRSRCLTTASSLTRVWLITPKYRCGGWCTLKEKANTVLSARCLLRKVHKRRIFFCWAKY